MEKYLLKSEEDFKNFVDKNSKYDLITTWELLKHYHFPEDFPIKYPCVLVVCTHDGGNQAGDYYRWDFVYLNEFTTKERLCSKEKR